MTPYIDFAYAAALIVIAAVAAGHAVMYKRDSRSAALWVIVIWVLPALGSILYYLLGINRVQRRAARLRGRLVRLRTQTQFPVTEPGQHFTPLARLVGTVVDRPPVGGNLVEALIDGAHAYPAMLDAIGAARSSLTLASYIFHGDGIGAQFVAALVAAKQRGVEVRVLIDDVDVRFSRGSAAKPLRRAGVPLAVFNPPALPARLHAVNLRNHRKILVADGSVAFTGGMNIDRRYWRPEAPEEAFRDLHFRLRGPVVAHLQEIFADDWQFSEGEALRGPPGFPP